MHGFATRAIHGGSRRRDAHGALRMPVYDNVAFEHESAQSLHLAFSGRKAVHSYTRISNPTVEDFEQRLRQLSGATAVLALASGMAAISTTILALAETGANIVTSRHLFGNSLSLLERTLRPWGLEVRCADMTEPETVAAAIDSSTRAVFLESITNPQLEVADCGRLALVTREHGVPLVVDNTMLTPYLFNTCQAGVNIELLSSTKYISGGATTLGGVIIDNGNFDWRRAPRLAARAGQMGQMAFIGSLRQEIHRNLGAALSPHNAYLQSLGLETLALRIDKSCANALLVARFLEDHPQVAAAHYPGLASSPFHDIAYRQFNGRYGGLITFELKDQAACFAFIDALNLIRRASNINDNKSLILHPASTIFAEYSEGERLAMGVRPAMLRLSVGIEDHEDLLEDLARGFASL